MPHTSFTAYARLVLDPANVRHSIEAESENAEYQAGIATIGGQRWRIRTAKLTPTKPGAFVSVWRRAQDGSTEPFPFDEPLEGLLVFVEHEGKFGVFRFTSQMLAGLGVSRSAAGGGKRGFRVYPAWCSGLNPQAARSQKAQAPAFIELGT